MSASISRVAGLRARLFTSTKVVYGIADPDVTGLPWRLFRAYSSWLVPGAVQTSAYTRAVLRAIAARRELPDDVEDAVAVRADRLRLLREGDHRFLVLIEESVLRNVIGGAEVMAGQLAHLITAVNPGASQPAVVEAALVLLERMGLSPADLVAVPQRFDPAMAMWPFRTPGAVVASGGPAGRRAGRAGWPSCPGRCRMR
jgi:hypothetical protein